MSDGADFSEFWVVSGTVRHVFGDFVDGRCVELMVLYCRRGVGHVTEHVTRHENRPGIQSKIPPGRFQHLYIYYLFFTQRTDAPERKLPYATETFSLDAL